MQQSDHEPADHGPAVADRAGDDQFGAEVLDESKTGQDRLFDDSGAPNYPAERLVGVGDPGADDWESDSVTSRHERENPELSPEDIDLDDADLDEPDDWRSPVRLVGSGQEDVIDDDLQEALDSEAELVARAVLSDPDDLSAEEAALHLE